MNDLSLAVCLDAVNPLERVKLTAELSSITKKVTGTISPIERVKAAKRMSDIIALLTGIEGQDADELSDDPNSPNYRYKDTGYIADSRKEQAQSMIFSAKKDGNRVRANDIDWDAIEQNPRQAADLVTKANLFGKTDWTALQETGMDPAAGFLIDKIYASIGPEPTAALPTATIKALANGSEELKSIDQLDRTSAEALAQTRKDYAVGLETIRDRLENRKTVDEVVGVIEDIRDELMGVQLSASQADEVAKLHALHEEKRGIAKTMQAEQDRVYQAWNRAQTEHRSAQYEQEKRERRKWKPDPVLDAKIRELELAVEQAHSDYENFRADHPEMQSQKREYASGGFNYLNDLEYEAYQVYLEIKAIERQAKMFNLMSNQVTRAWLTFGERFMKLVNYRSYRGSDSFAGHVTNAKSGKISDWSWADKDRPKQPKGATRQEINFQLKVADSYERKGGRDVSAASTSELKEIFGFRDVQSGNWVLKDPNSAKFHVEQTAAAMSDMADILGIDMKLLGYGGRLGMAFGARGSGGKNAARAHYEPVHRVINLTKMGGGGSLGHEWFHSMDNIIHEMMTGKVGEKDAFVTTQPDLLPAGKVREAVVALHDAIYAGDVPSAEVHKYTGKDILTAKHNIDRPHNSVSRAIKDAGNAADAVKAVDQIFNGSRQQASKMAKRWRVMAAAYYHEGESTRDGKYTVKLNTGETTSSFVAESAILDNGTMGKYWSQTEELAARAFQSFLEDRLADADRRNDYLSAMADNKFYIDPLLGVEWKPYPEGEERQRINAAFDKLFAAIREEKVFEKAVADDKLMDSIFGTGGSLDVSEAIAADGIVLDSSNRMDTLETADLNYRIGEVMILRITSPESRESIETPALVIGANVGGLYAGPPSFNIAFYSTWGSAEGPVSGVLQMNDLMLWRYEAGREPTDQEVDMFKEAMREHGSSLYFKRDGVIQERRLGIAPALPSI